MSVANESPYMSFYMIFVPRKGSLHRPSLTATYRQDFVYPSIPFVFFRGSSQCVENSSSLSHRHNPCLCRHVVAAGRWTPYPFGTHRERKQRIP